MVTIKRAWSSIERTRRTVGSGFINGNPFYYVLSAYDNTWRIFLLSSCCYARLNNKNFCANCHTPLGCGEPLKETALTVIESQATDDQWVDFVRALNPSYSTYEAIIATTEYKEKTLAYMEQAVEHARACTYSRDDEIYFDFPSDGESLELMFPHDKSKGILSYDQRNRTVTLVYDDSLYMGLYDGKTVEWGQGRFDNLFVPVNNQGNPFLGHGTHTYEYGYNMQDQLVKSYDEQLVWTLKKLTSIKKCREKDRR